MWSLPYRAVWVPLQLLVVQFITSVDGTVPNPPIYVTVDCAGDGAAGNATFSTIDAAQAFVAQLPRPLTSHVVVDIVSNCTVLTALALHGANDSGSGPNATVTWTSSTGAALRGGVSVPADLWAPVTSPPSVGVPPLPAGHTLLALNYTLLSTPITVGEYKSSGLGSCHQTRAELFIGGRPMTVARYPNVPVEPGEPWLDWMYVIGVGDGLLAARPQAGRAGAAAPRKRRSADHDEALLLEQRAARSEATLGGGMMDDDRRHVDGSDGGDPSRTFQALVDTPRARRWANMSAPERAAMWAHGYWKWDWADNYIQIDNVSVLPLLAAEPTNTSATAETANDSPPLSDVFLRWSKHTQPVYSMELFGRFYVLNIKSELDQAGEYYFDETAQQLYVVANASIDPRAPGANTHISVNPGGILDATGVSFLTISGLTFEYSRGHGVSISESSDVTVSRVTSSNHARGAFSGHGTSLRVDGLVSRYAGCAATSLRGGDHDTLAPSNNVMTGGLIERFARFTRTYNPGLDYGGVGHTVSNVVVAHGPHAGIDGSGNDMIFDSNHISHVCYGTNDAGAWYSGRSWVERGTVLVRNVFENITNREPSKSFRPVVHAVYLDDEMSGVSVLDTTCVNADTCLLLGGGRDNVIANMMCHNVAEHCATFDNRGMTWQRAMCSNGTGGPGRLVRGLEQCHYRQPPYSTAYAGLPTTMQDRPCVPVGNALVNVICTNCVAGGSAGPTLIDQTAATIASWNSSIVGSCSGAGCVV